MTNDMQTHFFTTIFNQKTKLIVTQSREDCKFRNSLPDQFTKPNKQLVPTTKPSFAVNKFNLIHSHNSDDMVRLSSLRQSKYSRQLMYKFFSINEAGHRIVSRLMR